MLVHSRRPAFPSRSRRWPGSRPARADVAGGRGARRRGENYQRARDGGSTEAIAVTELHNVADVLEGHQGERLHGDLICYSRAVVGDEWPAMARGERSDTVQHWIDGMVADFAATDPTNPKQEAGRSPCPRR